MIAVLSDSFNWNIFGLRIFGEWSEEPWCYTKFLRSTLLYAVNPYGEGGRGHNPLPLLRFLAIESYRVSHALSHIAHLTWDGNGPNVQPFTSTDQAGKTLDHGNGIR